ncbi:MAG TPA: ATP-grasp domain-containing protein, partial [Acidimicrobiales bacterium]|nr:ATP-grasp domain-containing protein [Acidimicrobiales bacterium]
MPNVLLIIPTGTYRAEEYLSAAERLGVTVITASERRQAMAGVMADQFLEVPLSDPGRAASLIVAHARRVGLDAVISIDDQGLLAAAMASEALGLRHSPAAAVALTRDKARMRAAFAAAGVPQPEYDVAPPLRAAEAAELLGLPAVLKPATLSASRGVIRVDTAAAASAAVRRIVAILADEGEPSDQLVAEKFVPGPEVAVEGICKGGEVHVITVFDKPDPLDGPYFEETFYVSPSRLSPGLLTAVEEATVAAIEALGITDGPFHAEMRVPGARPRPEVAWHSMNETSRAPVKVLEVAARTIGGRCSKAMRLENGWGLEELIISNALGGGWPPPPIAGPCGILMIPIPRSGVLQGVGGIERVRRLEGITGVEVTIPAGRPVRTLPEG